MSSSSRLPSALLRPRSGAALVVVLACIAILSGLVVAYFAQSMIQMQVSASNAGQTAAALFARGAVDSVIGELKQEITAGSTAYPPAGSDLRDPATPFLPAAAPAMLPCRMDSNAPVNVLKRSAYNRPFYSGPSYSAAWPAPSWAANLSTTNPGSSGRSIPLARWNRPFLMPTLSAASTNATPTNTFVPPDWIYMTRSAQPVTAWSPALVPDRISSAFNTADVVGRYAYVVYDEGGLLDANAAGYPSSVAAAQVRHKISQACADLTRIGLKQSDIDALVAWRNPVSGRTADAYTNYIYAGATNAFLTPAPGDRLFTSRQQLIAFLLKNVANGNAADVERMEQALPLLTHFSRELNAPSWYPQTNVTAGGAYAYLDNATNAAPVAANLFVPLVAAKTAYTNGSAMIVPPKQPLAFSRFPLSRIAWLGEAGPSGATAAQIQQSFGLVWDAAYSAWKYAGPTGSSVLNAIAPLSQIRGREPNFFELIKAAVLTGSVGAMPSTDVFNLAPIDSRYANADQHLVQIGLAMIDQASSSALPTRIEFDANVGANALYGSKNLPYLYRFLFSPYRPLADGSGQNTFDAWLEPVFWNPYQTVTTNSQPLQLRVRLASGQVYAQTMAPAGYVGTTLVYTYMPASPSVPSGDAATGASIKLDAASASTLAAFSTNPVTLAAVMSGGAASASITDSRSAPWGGSPDTYTEGGFTYAGFWLGHVTAPNKGAGAQVFTNTSGATYPTNYMTALAAFGQKAGKVPAQFVVEANYGSGFQEVQRMTFGYNGGISQSELDGFTVLGRRMCYYTIDDPRTGRFGFNNFYPPGYRKTQATTNTTIDPQDAASATWTSFQSATNLFTGNIHYHATNSATVTFVPNPGTTGPGSDYYDTFRYADNTSTANTSATPYYKDADGVKRRGDGWWNTAAANTLPMRADTPQDRPVRLNRSFYSVGELGYVFRDLPWRSLDFGTPDSADAGLLDFFCTEEGYAGTTNAPVVGGRVNLNTRHPEVLAALLSGAARAQLYPAADVSAKDAAAIAAAVTNATGSLPLRNKAELATRLAPADPTVVANAVAQADVDTNIKERREVLVPALANAGQVRTWNLLIDVIAQTGRFPPAAKGFGDFLVNAEQHYWAHVAIDRYTGQVVALQLEPVNE